MYYAKIVFAREGVVTEKEYKTKEEAEAYCAGFERAKEECENADELNNPLEEYFAAVDTEPATEEV